VNNHSLLRSRVLHQDSNKCWYTGSNDRILLKFTGDDADDNSFNFLHFYQFLLGRRFATFFDKSIGYCEHETCAVEYFPVIVMISTIANKRFADTYGLGYGSYFNNSILEWKFRSSQLSDPFVTIEHIKAFKLLGSCDIAKIESLARNVFHFLSGVFRGKRFDLGSISFQFGRNDRGEVVLATDLNSANIELWKTHDMKWIDLTPKKLREIFEF
jgi:phosphoribosylaminoimidazole-succinocarboxamide synthase